MELVGRGNESRHRGSPRARGPRSLGPVSRADHPVATCTPEVSPATLQEATVADLDLGSVRYTSCAYAKNIVVRLSCGQPGAALFPRGRLPLRRSDATPSVFCKSPTSIHHMPSRIHDRLRCPPNAASE